MSRPVRSAGAVRLRVVALLALVLAVSATAISPAQATTATATTTRTVSFRTSASALTAPGSLRLYGTAYKSPKGSAVVIERYADGEWRAYKNLRTLTGGGTFSFRFTTSRYGNTFYRARLPQTSRLSGATSVSREVGVYHAAQATLQASQDQIDAGDTVVLSGTVTPYQAGSAVTLQRLVGGVWTTDGDLGTVSSTGGYSFLRQPSAGVADYRAVTARDMTAFVAPGYSPSVSVDTVKSGGFATGFVTTLVSRASSGTLANKSSELPAISADGRYLSYSSDASNLVSGDTNGHSDVFVTDRTTGRTTRVSTATDGSQGDADSFDPAISADGRYVTYTSSATDLVPGDSGRHDDVFVTDRTTGRTTRVSTASDGTEGDDGSYAPAISDDGRYISFETFAANLVPGDTNGGDDVLVSDRTTGRTTRLSTATDGAQGDDWSYDSQISGNGRWVTYVSEASTLVPRDTNRQADVFVTDRTTGRTTRVSVDDHGAQGDDGSYRPQITEDGRYITYYSRATDLVVGDTNGHGDVFVTDRTTGRTTRVSTATGGTQGDGESFHPAISGDGRYVAYASDASTLGPGDTNDKTDVFVTDRTTGETTRVSTATGGTQGDVDSDLPAINGDGRYVIYQSGASTLVRGDTNKAVDVFVTAR